VLIVAEPRPLHRWKDAESAYLRHPYTTEITMRVTLFDLHVRKKHNITTNALEGCAWIAASPEQSTTLIKDSGAVYRAETTIMILTGDNLCESSQK